MIIFVLKRISAFGYTEVEGMLSIGGVSLNQRTNQSWGAVNGSSDRFSVRSDGNNHHNNVGINKQRNSAVSSLLGVNKSSTVESKRKRRDLLRDINKTTKTTISSDGTKHKVFEMVSDDKKNGFMDLKATRNTKKKEKSTKPVRYNYKEVAAKIQNAKNSTGAEQAVLSAKRKVLELKRKISSGDGDAEELQLALTHAKRMEMVARKKKHHLELEELVVTTQSRDERAEEFEENVSGVRDALITSAEDKIKSAEDDILDERVDMIDEALDDIKENNMEISEEELADLNEMIAEFGEEELKELEEAMEDLESLEIIDPHMSSEELKELKIKHRNSEHRDMVKADMDYLKEIIRHQLQTGGVSLSRDTDNASDTAVAYAGPGAAVLSMTMTTPEIGAALDMTI